MQLKMKVNLKHLDITNSKDGDNSLFYYFDNIQEIMKIS